MVGHKFITLFGLVAYCHYFLSIFVLIITFIGTFIQYIHPLHSLSSTLVFVIAVRSVEGLNQRADPRIELGSSYSSPQRYHLSYATPCLSYDKPVWATPHPVWATPHRCALYLLCHTHVWATMRRDWATRAPLSDQRRTLIKLRGTLSDLRRTLTELRSTLVWATPHPVITHLCLWHRLSF
jgi:hypothetical protein